MPGHQRAPTPISAHTHLQPRSRKNPLLIFSGLDILKAHLKVKYEAHKCTKWIRKNAPERVQATSVNVSAETQRAFECGECAACHVSLDPCATARGVQVQGWTHVHAFMSGEWIRRRHSDEQQKRCTRSPHAIPCSPAALDRQAGAEVYRRRLLLFPHGYQGAFEVCVVRPSETIPTARMHKLDRRGERYRHRPRRTHAARHAAARRATQWLREARRIHQM